MLCIKKSTCSEYEEGILDKFVYSLIGITAGHDILAALYRILIMSPHTIKEGFLFLFCYCCRCDICIGLGRAHLIISQYTHFMKNLGLTLDTRYTLIL